VAYGQKGTLTMGMNDESWCCECGKSIPYGDVLCEDC